jgi:hypothetical protein
MATHTPRGWIRRTIDRFVPMDNTLEPPDHKACLRADHSMCCPWHEEHSFWPSPEATRRLHEQVGGLVGAYIGERLGERHHR